MSVLEKRIDRAQALATEALGHGASILVGIHMACAWDAKGEETVRVSVDRGGRGASAAKLIAALDVRIKQGRGR